MVVGRLVTEGLGRSPKKPIYWVLGAFKTACLKAGIGSGRVFKDLRTSTASWLADAGVALQVAIHLLGHSPGSIGVHGRYARPRFEALREAIDKLPRLLT